MLSQVVHQVLAQGTARGVVPEIVPTLGVFGDVMEFAPQAVIEDSAGLEQPVADGFLETLGLPDGTWLVESPRSAPYSRAAIGRRYALVL